METNTQELSKRGKSVEFEVSLNWISKQKGILLADDAPGSIHVGTPAAFGGEEKEWTPEHLFLSAISSCFMTTYLVFAKKFKFDISGFHCAINGRVDVVEGKYQFTQIEMFPTACIQSEIWREKAELAMEKSKKYCLVSNSVRSALTYHTEVRVLNLKVEEPCM